MAGLGRLPLHACESLSQVEEGVGGDVRSAPFLAILGVCVKSLLEGTSLE